jgi:predicted DsbA family dithiol-disulfide isomerase
VARAAHAFAIANPHIKAEVVEASEFPELSRRYGVMGVPQTVINDQAQFVGGVPDEVFVNAILETLGQEAVDWEKELGLEQAGS